MCTNIILLMRSHQTNDSCKHQDTKRGRIPVQCSRYLQETYTTKTEKRPLYQWACPLFRCMFFLPASFGTLWIIANANVIPSKATLALLWGLRQWLGAKVRINEENTKCFWDFLSERVSVGLFPSVVYHQPSSFVQFPYDFLWLSFSEKNVQVSSIFHQITGNAFE